MPADDVVHHELDRSLGHHLERTEVGDVRVARPIPIQDLKRTHHAPVCRAKRLRPGQRPQVGEARRDARGYLGIVDDVFKRDLGCFFEITGEKLTCPLKLLRDVLNQ
jgi:hypothetical protein